MRLDAARLREIVAAGVLAPSAENRHFLRFVPVGEALEFLTTDVHTWSELPHRRMLALVSYGAVAENMALRSAEMGLAMTLDWLPDPRRPELIALLHWSETASAPFDPLAAALPLRHTHRGFYRRTPLAPDVLARIGEAAAEVPGARLIWLDEPPARTFALRAMRIAETERFRRRALHDELFGAVRFDIGWRRSAAEGLPPATLAIEPPLRLPFAQLRRWPLMRLLGGIGAHRMLGLRAGYLPGALAPHLGLIVADTGSDDAGLLQAGRALERAWLRAAAEGAALQPMAAATVLTRQRPGGDWVSPESQAALRQLLARLPVGGGTPVMLFRLGSAAPQAVTTGRPPAEGFIA